MGTKAKMKGLFKAANLADTALDEFGHILGLDHSPAFVRSIMVTSTISPSNFYTKRAKLYPYDIKEIQKIYTACADTICPKRCRQLVEETPDICTAQAEWARENCRNTCGCPAF